MDYTVMMPATINDVPVTCINQAASTYHLPATLILAIMKKENGKNGHAVRNKNDTYDFGVMQINSLWLPTLAPYGYTRHDLQFDACKNVMAGAWILAKNIADGKTAWTGVGNYHSRTQCLNYSYNSAIKDTYSKIRAITFSYSGSRYITGLKVS